MGRLSILVTVSFVSVRGSALAESDPSASPSAGLQPASAPTAEPPRPVDLRAGFHVGGSVGGAYLPITEPVSALFVCANLNWGRANGELRVVPMAFTARQGDDSSYGLGGQVARRWHASERMTVGVGVMGAAILGDGDASFAIGPGATPVAIRFGGRGHIELSLEAFLLHNFSTGSNLPGGYVSLTYLAL